MGHRGKGRESPLCHSLRGFQDTLQMTFDLVSTDREKAREMSGLMEGGGSVCDYAIRFCTLAAESGWNPTALYVVILKGLSAPIQELLVPVDLLADVDSLIALAIRTDNWIHELHQPQGGQPL